MALILGAAYADDATLHLGLDGERKMDDSLSG
jgi:hypothetical protein